ncbi:MAG: GGDEF domain-containing protein [Clostridia bacterium]
MKINSLVKEYRFEEDYFQFETTIYVNDELRYIIISQSPIQSSDRSPSKILHITDVTKNHIALSREKELLIEQSVIDDLTGLYNKNYFLKNYMNASATNKRNLQLIFIDIDDFKGINDSYGHLAGDEVLRTVATGIRNSIRNNEIAIRYGGDEFLIILENIMHNDAKMIAERIQENLSKTKFNMEMKNIKITLSIGLHNGNETMTDLLAKADQAMYFSKTHGKNKVTVFNDKLG